MKVANAVEVRANWCTTRLTLGGIDRPDERSVPDMKLADMTDVMFSYRTQET